MSEETDMGEPIKLSVKPLSLSERKKRRLEGLTVSLDDKDPKYFPSGDPHAILMKAAVPTDQRAAEPGKDQSTSTPPSDRSTTVLRSDRGATESQGEVAPEYYGHTVEQTPRHDRQTVVPRIDGKTVVTNSSQTDQAHDQTSIPLSELQWTVWQELQRLSQANERTCLQDLSKKINQKKRGVQRAIEALKKEGAIKLQYIKSKEFQGFLVETDPSVQFHQGSEKEVYGIIRRGLTVVPRHYGQTVAPRYPEHSMYVCKKNTYIRVEDITLLLQTSPTEWKIREQTLIQIADTFPTMTALEFRLSLLHLIDQAKNGKTTVHNPNAWLKASFERNNGPLVTEREIEVRVRQQEAHPQALPSKPSEESQTQDIETMRRYMTASPEEKAEIDKLADKRVERLLVTIAPDKHLGLHEEARIECAREYFAAKAKAGQG
jgi:hypothetical protein